MAKKYVYNFKEAHGLGKELLGGKGAGLAEMTHIGISIPQGFTVSTEACTLYYDSGKKLPDYLVKEIYDAIHGIEKETGKNFGGSHNPLLVSVRSGARASMPGMMDTILNLGLNDNTVEAMAKETNNERFAYDCYRRFIVMFSNIAKGHPRTEMDKMLEELKEERGYKLDTEITADELKELVKKYKAYYKKVFGDDFPSDPYQQALDAITAVFRSWDNPRANVYRKMNNIPYEWGTAVNVQSMVFGNKNEESGTGVAFSRSPSTGERKIFAEYLPNAQGEDVVAGLRTPLHIEELNTRMPKVYEEFVSTIGRMEKHYHDMQDMEFTVEDGKLYFLQTRSGKRTAHAALKIAVDMFETNMIDKERAIMLVKPEQLDTFLHPQFDESALKKAKRIGEGLPASPGAATGQVVFNVEQAIEQVNKGNKVVLVRLETSPEDIEGMHVSEGFLTARGGMTSHAAVVARGMGKCCVSGCHGLVVNEAKGFFTVGGEKYHLGDWISLDGSTGIVYGGKIDTRPATISGDFEKFMTWCDEIKTLDVRTNADTPNDAKQARAFGAQGIGLCRTEHMFFEADRIKAMREMIVSENIEQRKKALAKLLPMQQSDFEQIYEAMEGMPVTIRYLDPPLHEFLPTQDSDIEELAQELGVSKEKLIDKIASLHEFNPMMGHRGCRLSVSYPELAEMQTTAIIQAYINVMKRNPDYPAVPEIMIPLVGEVRELKFVKDIVVETADKLIKESKMDLKYLVGTMIEIPRAALLADEIAKEAEFFSFGTNDLTQMTFGFSRDDAGVFLKDYYEKRIYENDPFATIDQEGVGKLVEIAVKKGKEANPHLHLGVCGEHGGDPRSVEFFHKVGLDYVSCSPFRVPIARLAAAQSAIKYRK